MQVHNQPEKIEEMKKSDGNQLWSSCGFISIRLYFYTVCYSQHCLQVFGETQSQGRVEIPDASSRTGRGVARWRSAHQTAYPLSVETSQYFPPPVSWFHSASQSSPLQQCPNFSCTCFPSSLCQMLLKTYF